MDDDGTAGEAPRSAYTSLVGEALKFAADAHASQTRKGKHEPYLSHLLQVASLVIHYGGDEDQIIAGVLHDAVEDQGGQRMAEAIRVKFGDRVADIVLDCSDATPGPGTQKARGHSANGDTWIRSACPTPTGQGSWKRATNSPTCATSSRTSGKTAATCSAGSPVAGQARSSTTRRWERRSSRKSLMKPPA